VNFKYTRILNDEFGTQMVLTPIEFAVWRGSLDIAKIILTEGTNIDASHKNAVFLQAIEWCKHIDYGDLNNFIKFLMGGTKKWGQA
jgi:hypothetical protein